MKKISGVGAGERVTNRGDLTISGHVGRGAIIEVEEGSLIIEGNVDSHVLLKVSLSEKLINSSSITGLLQLGMSSQTGLRIGGSSVCGLFYADGKLVSMGNNIRSSIQINNVYIGNVAVDERIFTEGALERIGPDKFVITAAEQSMADLFSRSMASSSSRSAPPSGLVTALVDGKSYTGTRILIDGRVVSVEGGLTPVAASSARPEEEKPISPPRLEVKGSIGDGVSIHSDAAIDVKAIGKGCKITSRHKGITATAVGSATALEGKLAIKVVYAGEKCVLTSHQEGIQFERLADMATLLAREAITGGDVGDSCVLTSQQYGLTAGNLGAGVRVDVKDAIKVRNIGAGSHLTSRQYGLTARDVADLVVIEVRDAIEMTSVGSDCRITSGYYGISVEGVVGQRSHLTCRDEIVLDGLGDNSTLTSNFSSIKVKGRTGKQCIIKARDLIRLKDVDDDTAIESTNDEVEARNIGYRVRIRARNGIDVDGVSPAPDSCVLSCHRGKVRRPKPGLYSAPPVQALPVSSVGSAPSSFFGSSVSAAASSSSAASTSSQAVSSSSEIPSSFCCSITLELMEDPVLCTLDGMTYERSAITDWLNKSRNTPTRVNMAESQTVADILVPNRALREAIEAYTASLPKPQP